jgi:sialic acid synthase SpsE
MQTALGVPVGISDHYQGYEMAYAAVAAGADLIEKPISLDRHVPGPEKAWSVSAKDLAGLVDDLKELGRGLTGMPHKMTREQQLYRRRNRVSCVAGRDIARGETLDEDCVVFARPHKGIGVEHWDMVRGRRIARTKKAGQFINWKDLA